MICAVTKQINLKLYYPLEKSNQYMSDVHFCLENKIFTNCETLETLEEYGFALENICRERTRVNTDSFDNMLELVILFYYKMVVENHSFFITKPQSVDIIL